MKIPVLVKIYDIIKSKDKLMLELKNSKLFSKKYDFISSIGEACFCAEILTKFKLREFSSPFDWLSGSSFEKRCNLLAENFSGFIEKKDLEKIGEREKPEPCDIYHNNFNDLLFNNDFPLKGDLSQDYDKVKAKYNRRCSRFTEYLKSKSVLLVYMETADAEHNVSDEEIISETNKIIKAYNNKNIDLLYVKHNKNISDGECKFSALSENAFEVEVCNCGREDGYNGNVKNCSPFFKKIHRKFSLRKLILRISKTQTRIRVYFLGVKMLSFKYRR